MRLSEIAENYAVDKHRSCGHRYDGMDYAVHLSMVVGTAMRFINLIEDRNREVVISAAWAHDVIEDCRETYNDVKKVLGKEVAEIVYACTNEKGRTRKDRANDKFYSELYKNELAVFVKICDRISNMKYSCDSNSPMAKVYEVEADLFIEKLYIQKYQPLYTAIKDIIHTQNSNPSPVNHQPMTPEQIRKEAEAYVKSWYEKKSPILFKLRSQTGLLTDELIDIVAALQSKHAAEIEELKKENETLKKQNGAYKVSWEAQNKITAHAQKEAHQSKAAVLSVDSEREMNAILTAEIEAKDKEIERLKKENDRRTKLMERMYKQWCDSDDRNWKKFKTQNNL